MNEERNTDSNQTNQTNLTCNPGIDYQPSINNRVYQITSGSVTDVINIQAQFNPLLTSHSQAVVQITPGNWIGIGMTWAATIFDNQKTQRSADNLLVDFCNFIKDAER